MAIRFVFSQDLGQRLRRLRQQRGLSLARIARLMGRKTRGAASLISQLERGKIKNPSIGLIADYLRACRASFNDIVDLLNSYTSQPVVEEGAVDQVEITPAKPKFVRTPGEKAKRRREGYILKQLGEAVARTSVCGELCQLGRRWFDILWRTRNRPVSREKQLAKEMAKGFSQKLQPEWVAQARGEMEKLAEKAIANPPPVPEDAHPGLLPAPMRADDRFLIERRARLDQQYQQQRLQKGSSQD